MASTVARNLARIKPGTLFAGVDLGLQSHQVTVCDAQARRLTRFAFANCREGFERFFAHLERLQVQQGAPEVVVAMEPSGYLWAPLAQATQQHGQLCVLVNAYTVHRRREGDNLDPSKDDRRDGDAICEAARTGAFTQTRLQEGRYAQLRHLVGRLEATKRDVARQRNRLRSDIATVFPEFFRVFPDPLATTAQAVLRHGALPAGVGDRDVEGWMGEVRGVYEGRRLAAGRLRRLHALAADSVGYVGAGEAVQMTIRQGLRRLEGLREEVGELEGEICRLAGGVPGVEQALTLPGMSLVTLGRILGHIGDPQRYCTGKQLAKLAGLQPTPHLSGQRRSGRTPMARQGRQGLRTVLFFATLRLIQREGPFRTAYERLRRRPEHPLQRMEAIGALMNKLIRILWTLMAQRVAYDPKLAFAE